MSKRKNLQGEGHSLVPLECQLFVENKLPSVHGINVIDKELQHTDDFIFYVTHLAFCLVLDK